MAISPVPLPYGRDALEPFISRRTLDAHYDGHYAQYVAKLQGLIKDTPMQALGLAEIVRRTWQTGHLPEFNNAAQAWNHEFYFASLTPQQQVPDGIIVALVERDFGSVAQLQQAIVKAALSHFASGWVWLVLDHRQLRVVTTTNADSPLLYRRQQPLFTIDVWEHAYYLDYQHDRERYVRDVTTNLVNWDTVNARLADHVDADGKAPWARSAG